MVGLEQRVGQVVDERTLERSVEDFLLVVHKHAHGGAFQGVDDARAVVHNLIVYVGIVGIAVLQRLPLVLLEEAEEQVDRLLIGENA